MSQLDRIAQFLTELTREFTFLTWWKRKYEISGLIYLTSQHELIGGKACAAIDSGSDCPSNLREIYIPMPLCLPNITANCCHQRAVISFDLPIGGGSVRGGARLIDVQQLLEQGALKVTSLIGLDLQRVTEPTEKFVKAIV